MSATMQAMEGRNRVIPMIEIDDAELPRMVDEAEAALLQAERGVYQNAGRIVTVGSVPITVAGGSEAPSLQIIECNEGALTEHFAASAKWTKQHRQTGLDRPAGVPRPVVQAYRGRVGHWCLPVLTAVITAPTMRADGSILDQPGYDGATGLLYVPGDVVFPDIPEKPTRAAAEAALALLLTLIRDFPFVTDASRAVAVSAMLTAVIRRSLPTAPLHAYTAPAAGTGKTKLVELASLMASGRESGVIAQGQHDEETEKRLTALLLAGVAVINLDNLEAPLGGDLLCQMLTQQTVRGRVLGRSEAPEMQACVFMAATGNNLRIRGDMTRRVVLCSLDAGEELPERRQFDHDPIAAVKADRGRYVAAVLTILRAYHVAGRPGRPERVGSFPEWSDLVRGALLWLGMADPADTADEVRATDPHKEIREAVIGQLRAEFGDQRFTVGQAINAADPQAPTMAPITDDNREALNEALMAAAGHGAKINSAKLGRWLGANVGRIANGLRIEKGKLRDGIATWLIVSAS